MAVTNEQVAAYLASNPNLSDAEIAQVAAAAGVSAQQLSEVTGVPVAQIQSRVAAAAPSIQLPSTAPQAPTKTWDEAYSEYGNALRSGDVTASTIKDLYGGLSSDFSSNIIKIKSEIDAQKQAGTADYWGAGNLASPDSAAWDAAFRLAEKGVGSLYDLKQVDGQTVNAKTGQPLEGFGNAYNYDLDYNLQFSPEGIPVLTASNQQSDWVSKWRPAAQVLGQIALGATGVGGMLGSSLGLTGTAANVAGGALLGGGTSALTGGNVLKGALLGGGGAYVSSLLNSGVTDPDLLQAAYDADVAGGMIPEFGTNAAYDSFMQAAMTPAAQAAIEQMINQPYIDADVAGGMVPEYGTNEAYDAFMQSAMTPEAKAAIEQTIANSSVAGMTPEQILQQGDMITDIASGNAMGPMTADQLGQAFEEYMAHGGYTPVTTGQGALGSTVTTNTGTTTGAGAAGTGLGGLTAPQIANLIKAGVSIAGITGAVNAVSPSKTTVSPQATPTQGMPTYSPEYYQQLQQYYNAYLPQTPRDVVTPLQQWYNTKSGA